jgi:hypothetical protein
VSARVLLMTLLMSVACTSAQLAPPVLRTRKGPGDPRAVKRVVALPATCGALSLERVETADPHAPLFLPRKCPEQALKGVDQAIRSALDFQGLVVIDSERVNAVSATRHEVEVRRGYSATVRTEQQASMFEDATPLEQVEILRELRADGLLNTRIFIGAGMGLSARRTVTVQVRLRTVDGALVWARRCDVEVGLTMDQAAIEQAAKCAIEGAR